MSKVQRPKILVVDDDVSLRNILASFLNGRGFDTLLAGDTSNLASTVQRFRPAAVVLDRVLPNDDGATACSMLRAQGEDVPIIMLTARNEPAERVQGLLAGADDYLGKPFDPVELHARLCALMRRHPPCATRSGNTIRFGDFTFDPLARQLTRKGQGVPLTESDSAILEILSRHPNRVFTREQLLRRLRPNDAQRSARSVDVAIFRLRQVVEREPANPRYVQSVRSVGYMFVPDSSP
jgi:two-component system phosphate regulon response regulator OmpR